MDSTLDTGSGPERHRRDTRSALAEASDVEPPTTPVKVYNYIRVVKLASLHLTAISNRHYNLNMPLTCPSALIKIIISYCVSCTTTHFSNYTQNIFINYIEITLTLNKSNLYKNHLVLGPRHKILNM